MKTNFTAEELEQVKKFIAPANIEQFEKMIESKSAFTKDDLINGDKVITKNEKLWLVIKDCNTVHYGRQSFILINLGDTYCFMTSDAYNNRLRAIGSEEEDEYDDYDIMKVYRDGEGYMTGNSVKPNVSSYDLIWSRE